MATPATVNPFNFYPGRDGLPLQNGYLYFGEPFQDPELQPLQAYWDDSNTQPAARPIRTINGYPARNGAPAQVFVGAQYSMRVRDSQGREVFYAPNVTAVDLGGGGLDIITASGGQTVVTLTNAIYTPGSNAIDIALNGIIQISGQDYFETGTDRITMASALSAGDQIRAFARSTFGLTQAVLSDWQAEVFNGAGGASQNFVLQRSPGAVANLDVSVTTAGVGSTLRPLIDYTLSGNTVTITPAPAVGTNNVLIRYGRSLPQDALRGELADPTSASNGAGLSGFGPTLNYVAATIGAAVRDGRVNVMWFLTEAERQQVKGYTYTIDLTSKINAAKAFAGNRPLYFPAGGWAFSSFNGKGWYGSIIGDGIGVTILKCISGVSDALDFNETSDVIISPFVLANFTLDGNNFAANGINIRYRHQSVMENVYVIGCYGWGIKEKDAWNSRRYNVRCTGNANNHWLVGSNHGSVFEACVWSGAAGLQLQVQTAGTAADGNSGLKFTNCQAVDGAGQGVDIACTSATFDTCYLGENISGVVFIFRSGDITINGGTLFFGYTATSYLFAPVGGKCTVTGAKVSGQTFGSTGTLNSTNVGGKWSLRDCEVSITAGGDQVLLGDVLDYGPPAVVFAKRLGRVLSSSANNATRTELISGNAITCTCTAAPGPTPNITITALLTATRPEWRDGETLYLVVVYISNAVFNARFSGSALGGAPTAIIGALPSTSSAIRTYVKVDVTAVAAAYDRLEFYRDNCAVNDFLKIEEVFLADSRMLNKGSGSVGNLFKC